MKNPFERFMQPREKSPEQAVHAIQSVIMRELKKLGTGFGGMRNAYDAAKELKEKEGLDISRDRILDILRVEAEAFVDVDQEELQRQLGKNIEDLIDAEIESIRQEEDGSE